MPLLEQARRFFDALNAQELDAVAAMIAPTADIRTPIGSFTGGEAYRDWMAMHFRALPDFVHEIRGFAAEEGKRWLSSYTPAALSVDRWHCPAAMRPPPDAA